MVPGGHRAVQRRQGRLDFRVKFDSDKYVQCRSEQGQAVDEKNLVGYMLLYYYCQTRLEDCYVQMLGIDGECICI